MRNSKTGSSANAVMLFLPLVFAGCSNETKATHEAATHETSSGDQASDMTQSPTDIEPTSLMLNFEDRERKLPASARLDLGADGNVVFSAQAKTSDDVFSLRFAIASKDEPLRGQMFKLEPGARQPNEISLVQGQLPNATTLRSVGGTAQFEHFGKDAVELTFDVELSRDPRGGAASSRATGTLRGGVLFVCTKVAAPSAQGQTQASSGQNQTTTSLPDKECRAQLAKLSSD